MFFRSEAGYGLLFARLFLLLRLLLWLRLRPRLRLRLRLRLRPRLWLRLRSRLRLRLRPRLWLRLRPRLWLRLRPRLRLRTRLRLGLRSRLWLGLRPRLRLRLRLRLRCHMLRLGTRLRLRLRPRLWLRLSLRPRLRLRPRLHLRRNCGRCRSVRARTCGGHTGLDPGLHLTGFTTRLDHAGAWGAALYLSRFPRCSRWRHTRFGPRLHPRLNSRFGARGPRRLTQGGLQWGGYRLNLLLRRQLLDLRLLLRAQLHGGLGRQRCPGQATLHRLGRQRRSLGNLRFQRRHIFRGVHEVGFTQVRAGRLDVSQLLGLRQSLTLHQGRWSDLP